MTTAHPAVTAAASLAESAEHERNRADNWNADHPVGTRVILRRDDESTIETYTCSPAMIIGGHSAVIWVWGGREAECYLLSRVTAIP